VLRGNAFVDLSKLTRGGRPIVDEDDFDVVPALDDRAENDLGTGS
jgi:hypothetical protein